MLDRLPYSLLEDPFIQFAKGLQLLINMGCRCPDMACDGPTCPEDAEEVNWPVYLPGSKVILEE